MLDSKHPKYKKDDYVCGFFGWRTHTIFAPAAHAEKGETKLEYLLPALGELPLSLGLGQLGMPGNAAYFGFLDICKPVSGEIVVISSAAGAVGCIVGQIAKIKGCKVIGIAGRDDKCNWLTKNMGFDYCINYKTESVKDKLKEYAPSGVNCYFDNVGGEVSSIVHQQMVEHGRVAVCGATSVYNLKEEDYPKVTMPEPNIVFKQLEVTGYIVTKYWLRWFEGINQLKVWTDEGKIKYHEEFVQGFENMPTALIEMMEGKNTGKVIVTV